MEKSLINKCCIVFPCSHSKLCNFIAKHISEKFQIECIAIKHKRFDKKTISQIEKILREVCILVVGYNEKITPENCYKLGIAQGFSRQVVLINLSPSQVLAPNGSIGYVNDIPKYVRYQFLILFLDDSPQEFVGAYPEVGGVLLSGERLI